MIAEIALQIQERCRLIDTPESRRVGLSFQPKDDDVVLSTAMKSGTTWVQQICHGLRTRGSMDFEEIAAVIPMLEDAQDYGYGDLEEEQPARPRMYKTHTAYEDCPKGAGRYIIVVRDPKDTVVSAYHFLSNWIFSTDEVSLEDFVEWFFIQSGGDPSPNAGQLHHIESWYPYRKDANKLWIHYEDLKADLTGSVEMISDFLQIGVGDTELLKLVERQASFEFMKKHWRQFDDHLLKNARNVAAGLQQTAGIKSENAKVRKGEATGGRDLSPELRAKMDAKWKQVMEPATGYKSYKEMRHGINKELSRSFP